MKTVMPGFELVEKVCDDLVERKDVLHVEPGLVQVKDGHLQIGEKVLTSEIFAKKIIKTCWQKRVRRQIWLKINDFFTFEHWTFDNSADFGTEISVGGDTDLFAASVVAQLEDGRQVVARGDNGGPHNRLLSHKQTRLFFFAEILKKDLLTSSTFRFKPSSWNSFQY